MALKLVLDTVDDLPEDVRKEYKEKDGKFHLDVDGGIKTNEDVTRLSGALQKERKDHGETKNKLTPFLSLGDVVEVQAQLARIPELETLAEGKVDDKKINAIVETRLASKVAPVQRELENIKTTNVDLAKQLDQFRTKEKTRAIHDAVRGAAVKEKLRPEAVEDALLIAERVFDVDETSGVIAKENVGVTPGVDPVTWLTEMKSKRPHWWPESSGGGAGGSGGGGGGANPWTDKDWNMTEQGRIYKENPTRAAQLAKSAGTSIGGGRPRKT